MSFATVFAIVALYAVTVLGDGCLLIAIALAAATGGNPLAWGVSFGLAHLLYALGGAALAAELAHQSEALGSLATFGGSLVLLRHFFHHRLHHQPGGDCSCEHHDHEHIKLSTIFLTSMALSFHSIATGAVIREVLGISSYVALVAIIAFGAILLGASVGLLVLIGETERPALTKIIDRMPGVSAAVLCGLSVMSLVHFLEHAELLSEYGELAMLVVGAGLSLTVGYLAHDRAAGQRLIQLESRKA